MAGSVCFHEVAGITDAKAIALIGTVKAEEAISVLPTTTTIVADSGTIATVWYDTTVVVKRFAQGASVPSEGIRIPAGFVERLAVREGDVVRLEAG